MRAADFFWLVRFECLLTEKKRARSAVVSSAYPVVVNDAVGVYSNPFSAAMAAS